MSSNSKKKSASIKNSTEKSSTENTRAWTSVNPPLSPWLLEALDCMGFTKMTPVQAGVIPLFLGNKDVVVEAVTGSGKTLAYLIPMVERILRVEEAKRHHVEGIIIAPTRELATQIFTVLNNLLKFHDPSTDIKPGLKKDEINVSAFTEDKATETATETIGAKKITPMLLLGGGQSAAQDLKQFLKLSPNLLIGTPGRLNDLLSSQYCHCTDTSFEALVLDEADRLLDLGFEDVLTKILARLPKQRRTGLFSATVTDTVVGSLVRAGLRNPVKIAVKVKTGGKLQEEKRTPASLDMTYLLTTHMQKLGYLRKIFSTPTTPQKAIIYFSTCAHVDYFANLLAAAGIIPKAITLISLHGKLSPSIRKKNFDKFTKLSSPVVLFTTDLAARGLDIPQVDLVIQYDAPNDPKTFLHRAGRAGRAGRKGQAILFLNPNRESEYVDFLEVRKTPVTLIDSKVFGGPPSLEECEVLVKRMRDRVLKDRAAYEKGLVAFVGWVKAYAKHQTSSIFRIQDIDWEDLAHSFALVRMPKMPELKKLEVKVDLGLGDIDTSTIPYASAHLEEQRQKALANPVPPEERQEKKKKRKQTEAWSEQKERKETRVERRERKKLKREKERQANLSEAAKAQEEEWKSLVQEVIKQRKAKEAATDLEMEDL